MDQLRHSGVSRLPGDPRLVTRRRTLREGIPLPTAQLSELRGLAENA